MVKMSERQVYFVCISIKSNELVSDTIPANSSAEASQIFIDKFDCLPQQICGPFYKKKSKVIETTRTLKFSNQNKKAIYNDWLVNAFLLIEPANQAYLIFIKRMDDKKMSLPKGTITVPVSNLRFI